MSDRVRTKDLLLGAIVGTNQQAAGVVSATSQPVS